MDGDVRCLYGGVGKDVWAECLGGAEESPSSSKVVYVVSLLSDFRLLHGRLQMLRLSICCLTERFVLFWNLTVIFVRIASRKIIVTRCYGVSSLVVLNYKNLNLPLLSQLNVLSRSP